MLVLSQEVGGEYVIKHGAELLRIVVRPFHGRRIKLGFEGPESFDVYRGEVWEKICNGPTNCRAD
jgi:sRNA-binding carbon storage regulator CsrA